MFQRRQPGHFQILVDPLRQIPDHVFRRGRLQQAAYVEPGERNYDYGRAFLVVAANATRYIVDQHLGRFPAVIFVDRPFFPPFHRLWKKNLNTYIVIIIHCTQMRCGTSIYSAYNNCIKAIFYEFFFKFLPDDKSALKVVTVVLTSVVAKSNRHEYDDLQE